jgi:hypothetical protein
MDGKFTHVFWLGGSAAAGKTSVARRLAAEHGLSHYCCDDRFEDHRRRAHPGRHPHFLRVADLPPEDLWARPAAEQARDLVLFYREEFALVAEDLQALPGPVIAEGVGLLPDLLPDPPKAVCLIATPAFRRAAYPGRGAFVQELLTRCPDPGQAFANWMDRDDEIARLVEGQARRLGLAVVTVDGTRGVEEVAREVGRLLGLGG